MNDLVILRGGPGAEPEMFSGAIVDFSTPVNRQIQSLAANIDASGTAEVTVWHTGKNLLDKSDNLLNGLYINSSQKKIMSLGGTGGASIYCPIKGGRTYTVSKIASARFILGVSANVPALNTVCTRTASQNNSSPVTSLSIVADPGDKYLTVFFYHGTADTTYTMQEILDTIQVELGAAASEYEPFDGARYSITIPSPPGSIADGSVDFITGILIDNTAPAETYQLRPPSVLYSKEGQNVIWSDAADVTVRYK